MSFAAFRLFNGRVVHGQSDGPLYRLDMANSYTRMSATLDCARRSDFWLILGDMWESCDDIARHRTRLERLLRARSRRWPIPEAMTSAELAHWQALPNAVTVWRGCYRENMNGLSWSLNRDVAAGFPLLNRYRREGRLPLLLEGRLRKAKIAFVKLERGESEVVTLPNFVRQRCCWLLR